MSFYRFVKQGEATSGEVGNTFDLPTNGRPFTASSAATDQPATRGEEFFRFSSR